MTLGGDSSKAAMVPRYWAVETMPEILLAFSHGFGEMWHSDMISAFLPPFHANARIFRFDIVLKSSILSQCSSISCKCLTQNTRARASGAEVPNSGQVFDIGSQGYARTRAHTCKSSESARARLLGKKSTNPTEFCMHY